MKAIEIVQNIINLKAGGKSSDDNPMSPMQWLFIIDYYRSQVIRNQQTNNQSVSSFNEQEIEVSIEQDDLDPNLYVTAIIPKPIELHKKDLITYVGDGDILSYQRSSYNGYQWLKYRKYTAEQAFYFTKDKKVYVGNHSGSTRVYIRMVAERPIEVVKLNGEYNPLFPLDFDYPMSNSIMDSVIKMIADAEMKLLHMLPIDNLNDGITQ